MDKAVVNEKGTGGSTNELPIKLIQAKCYVLLVQSKSALSKTFQTANYQETNEST